MTRPGQWGNPEIEVRAEGQGRPVAFVATPGQRHEATAFDRLIGQGRPKVRPRRFVGDKDNSSRAIRTPLRRCGIRMTIPRKAGERRWVERLINRLKQFRRAARRYENRAANDLAKVTIAAIRLW
ncbi:MAG: hypothetical protein QOJ59_4515 [Thermomicrobiales bacterium]|nr:hypothetical protein [Thermomicrobiales bacterium]